MKLSEGNKLPGTRIFVSLRSPLQVIWGQVSHATSPIISLWEMLKLLIWQHKLDNRNSEALQIVMHYCHAPFVYCCIFIVWRHRCLTWSSSFFVHNFRLNWDRVEKGTTVMAMRSWIGWNATWPHSVTCDLREFDRTLTSGAILTALYLTNDIIWRGLMRGLRWCLEFGSVWPFWRSFGPKNKTPRVIDLTSEVTGWLDTLYFVTIRCVS